MLAQEGNGESEVKGKVVEVQIQAAGDADLVRSGSNRAATSRDSLSTAKHLLAAPPKRHANTTTGL
jgi:hypothetical protein